MVGIDLFSGAGGMSIGATMAGVRISLAIEADRSAAATYAQNHPNTPVLQKDIRLVDPLSIPQISKLKRTKEPTVIFGGPPCRGFSTSNQRTRSASNPSNWLFREYTRFVKTIHPDWIVFENVRGIIETERGAFLEHIMRELKKIGYTLSFGVLNAKDFGIPQDRSRLFIIGSLHGVSLPLPKGKSHRQITVQEALSDLPELENGASSDMLRYPVKASTSYAKMLRGTLTHCSGHLVTRNASYVLSRYRHIPQGGNWEQIPSRLMKNYADPSRCHTGIYYRLKENEPSIVIGNFRKNMLIHPRQDRGLSVREAARLQSFPDWFRFTGSIGFQQQQVGNAVPPFLAKAIFQELLSINQSGDCT
ncbi:MAG: DNA cytosine methyltransferase [Nitrospira sp.]|jgi:DNA (cytosine-5)-methyltransferase 1|nr:DNA cytosine methyltransferase [Nitrospira sp.]